MKGDYSRKKASWGWDGRESVGRGRFRHSIKTLAGSKRGVPRKGGGIIGPSGTEREWKERISGSLTTNSEEAGLNAGFNRERK